MDAVAKSLQSGLLFDDVVNLVGDTENCCVSQLEDKFGVDVVKKQSFRSSLFWQLFVMGVPGRSLPATAIIRSIDGLIVEGIQPSVQSGLGNYSSTLRTFRPHRFIFCSRLCVETLCRNVAMWLVS